MASVGTVVIEVDANIAKLVDGMKKSNAQISQLQRTATSAKDSIANFAKVVGGVYLVNKAFDLATAAAQSFIDTSSQFEQYGNRMTAFTNSQAEANSEIQRATSFARNWNLSIADTTETMLTLKNYGIDDTNESLKIFTNTAIGSGKSLSQYAEAVADALTGENERLKEFGLKASKIGEQIGYVWTDSSGKTRNVIIQNNKEIINSTLNAIMNEKYVGQIEKNASSWKGLMTSINNNWVILKKNIGDEGLFDYFRLLGESITKTLGTSFSNGSISAKQFADDTISFIQSILKGVGYLAKALSGIANLARTVYAGFLKLNGAIGQDMNTRRIDNVTESLKELQRIKKEGDYGTFSNQNEHIVDIKIKKATKELSEYNSELERYTGIRIEGDSLVEAAAKSQENINKIIDSVANISVKSSGAIKAVTSDIAKQKEAAVLALQGINAGFGGLDGSAEKASKKAAKAAKEAATKAAKAFKDMPPFEPKINIEDLNSKLADVAKNFTENMQNGISSLANAYKDGGMAAVGDVIGNMLVDGANTLIPGLGTAMEVVGALFSSRVSQAEIDAAKGRVEFDDDSLKNLASMFENAQYPMLEVTNKMHNHIRNMDANFFAIARAMSAEASSGGVDLTGVNFVDTMSSGFLGFSSESISLISTGLKFELQNLGDMMNAATLNVRGYTTTLVEESSWWGLSSDSSIKKAFKNLPPSVVEDIADSFSNGYEAILLAGTTLGLNEVDLADQLKNADINLKEIDFTGLSPDEVSDRLSQAFGTAFTSVIGGIDEFTNLVSRYAKDSEYALETLVRIATTYDQASHSFNILGKDFTDGTVDILKEWSTTSETIRLMFGRTTGGITTYFSEMATEIYTAQMQILDIVESAGGMDSFNDAMSAFMGDFYTDAEQLGFLTKSMEASFSTLKITMPETNEEFRNLLETMDTSTEEGAYLYGQVLLLADGFSQMSKATESLGTSMEDMIKNVSDAWLGNLSYLTMKQKTEYASGYLAIASSSNGAIDTVEAARLAAEIGMKSISTREEYIPVFERYVSELEKQAPKATTDDVVARLDTLIDRVVELEQTTRQTA